MLTVIFFLWAPVRTFGVIMHYFRDQLGLAETICQIILKFSSMFNILIAFRLQILLKIRESSLIVCFYETLLASQSGLMTAVPW